MKTKLLFIFLLLMQCKIFAQIILKQNLEIVCREQHCSMQKADSILRNCAYILFDSTRVRVGNIPEGPSFKIRLSFINIGCKPLVLNWALGSGSLYAAYPKEPILPMETRYVDIYKPTFGRKGEAFNKALGVSSNAYNKQINILISGTVEK